MYTDSTDSTIYEVQVFEGLDFAFGRDDQPLHARVAVPIVFSYLAESSSRTADLLISAGDATLSRKDRIDVTDTAGTTSFNDELVSADGDSWDALTKAITIPTGVSSTTVQLFSEPFGQNPDSLLWEVGVLRIRIASDVPAIDIRKEAEGSDSRTFPSGSGVGFEIVVTNTGSVDLKDVEVTDALVSACDRFIGNLAAGDFFQYDCTALDVLVGFGNEACVVEEDPLTGVMVDDCDPSEVVIESGSCDDGKPIELVFEYTDLVVVQ